LGCKKFWFTAAHFPQTSAYVCLCGTVDIPRAGDEEQWLLLTLPRFWTSLS